MTVPDRGARVNAGPELRCCTGFASEAAHNPTLGASPGCNSCVLIIILLQVNTLIVSTAAVATARAPRYGKQLVSHLGRRSVGSWDETTGAGTLDMNDNAAHVTLNSTPEALLIEIRCADAATYEDVVGRHLVRFGERDELKVSWERSDGTAGSSQG